MNTRANEAPRVALVDITLDNYLDVVELCVSPEQEKFVGTVAESIADAHFHRTYSMRAIARKSDETLVGFLMYEHRERDRYLLLRLLVDCHHQGKGYGTAAVREWLKQIAPAHGEHSYTIVEVPVHVENEAALAFYRRLGFSFATAREEKTRAGYRGVMLLDAPRLSVPP